ncbi:MAG: lysylphosphatidylglycerol synthase transmembrane domain-containing protein [Armatimonadota bacterium]|nr:flippase-like domain-containing protein [bacterium]
MRRRWIFWILIIIAIAVVIARSTEVSRLAQTLYNGVWEWVIVSAVLQFLFYSMYAAMYRISFSTVQVESRIHDLLPVVFSSIFVNVAVPTGGASGLALFIDDAVRRGQSAARATAGVLLLLTVDFSAFAVVLGLGLASLAISGNLHSYELGAAGILIAIIISLNVALFMGLWKPWILLHMLKWIQRLVDRVAGWFKRQDYLPEDWAATHAMDFAAASAAIAAHPLRLARTFAVSLIAQAINVASLYVLFLAFFHPVPIGTVVAGYAIGNLFWIVSITPQGVGVVEGVMALAFSSLGVPVETSAVIAVAYRGLAFWLPMGVGFIVLRRVRSFRHERGI